MTSDAPPPRRPLVAALRGLALALLPLLVLVVASEAVLAWLGLGDPDQQLSLSRGFDPRARYLVPADDPPGAWRTQMLDGKGRERLIPPKAPGARRVVLVGGSNTAGFPEQELRRRLGLLDPATTWDVVNLGRPGYGSERVAIIVDQSFALEPDVLVVYAGHNEFVERGFALELLDAGASPFSRRLDLLASRLRLHNVLARALAPGEDYWTRVGREPEQRRKRDGRFRDLTLDETRFVFDVYRRNLERMVLAARDHDVRVLVCTVIGNDLSPPMVDGREAFVGHADAEAFAAALEAAREAVPPRLLDGLVPPVRLRWTDWRDDLVAPVDPPAPAPDDASRPRVPPLRPLSGPLADAPATSGDKMNSVAGAHHSDPAGWTPDVWRVLDTLHALLVAPREPAERAALERARRLYDEAVALRPDDPGARFERGLCALALGDGAAAHDDLRAAARLDRAPRKGNDVSNGHVRALAADLDVPLLDAEARFRERCPDGILGYEVMMDVCHLHPGARPVLMQDLAEAVAGLGAR